MNSMRFMIIQEFYQFYLTNFFEKGYVLPICLSFIFEHTVESGAVRP